MRALVSIVLFMLAPAAMAAPVPVFQSPADLLDAVYAQHEGGGTDDYDPDAYFAETDTFSARLASLYAEADAKFQAAGDEMGALDFSPFINGQDSGGLSFAVAPPKAKGDRAVTDVGISLDGDLLYTVTFHFVDEGSERGWKVDDILLPMGDAEGTWSLAEYFADPFIP